MAAADQMQKLNNPLAMQEPAMIGLSTMANGLTFGLSEAQTFRTEFLRSLKARGLGGLKLVISDARIGLKAAIRRGVRGNTATGHCRGRNSPRRRTDSSRSGQGAGPG